MPIHDWTLVDPGIFHHFHQAWTIEISNALNSGALPPGFFALADQIVGGPMPDVVTLQRRPAPRARPERPGGIAVADAPPQARFITSAELDVYTHKANRIVIKHQLGKVVAVIEVVSPGNKNGSHALRSFVEKAREILRNGINLFIVDLFPPSARDPQGIHKAIWDEIQQEPFELPPDKPLTVAAYSAGEPITAYVEPVAVGDPLPELPLFLDARTYVPAPLEATYQETWFKCPAELGSWSRKMNKAKESPRMGRPGAQKRECALRLASYLQFRSIRAKTLSALGMLQDVSGFGSKRYLAFENVGMADLQIPA